jgi:hypothetical protein
MLVDAVWGDDPPSTAGNLPQGYVSGLPKELGRDAIETSEPGYRLRVQPDAFDLRQFERLVADGSATLVALDPRALPELVTLAEALLHGRDHAELIIATTVSQRPLSRPRPRLSTSTGPS